MSPSDMRARADALEQSFADWPAKSGGVANVRVTTVSEEEARALAAALRHGADAIESLRIAPVERATHSHPVKMTSSSGSWESDYADANVVIMDGERDLGAARKPDWVALIPIALIAYLQVVPASRGALYSAIHDDSGTLAPFMELPDVLAKPVRALAQMMANAKRRAHLEAV